MCIGIPMRVVEVNGFNARCEARGVEREVSLFMMQDQTVEVGEYLITNLGYALNKVSEEEALSTWSLFDEITEKAGSMRD